MLAQATHVGVLCSSMQVIPGVMRAELMIEMQAKSSRPSTVAAQWSILKGLALLQRMHVDSRKQRSFHCPATRGNT